MNAFDDEISVEEKPTANVVADSIVVWKFVGDVGEANVTVITDVLVAFCSAIKVVINSESTVVFAVSTLLVLSIFAEEPAVDVFSNVASDDELLCFVKCDVEDAIASVLVVSVENAAEAVAVEVGTGDLIVVVTNSVDVEVSKSGVDVRGVVVALLELIVVDEKIRVEGLVEVLITDVANDLEVVWKLVLVAGVEEANVVVTGVLVVPML